MDVVAQLLQSFGIEISSLRLGLLGRLLLAAFLGGLIGWEREASAKPAGLRTNMLICIGAALLGDVSLHFAELAQVGRVQADPARIAAQVVSGIGFLGAGTIIQSRGAVTGLTTAATLWVVAGIGLAAGASQYAAAVGTTLLVLVALLPLGMLEGWIEARHASRVFRIVAGFHAGVVDEVESALRAVGLEVEVEEATRDLHRDTVTLVIKVHGSMDEVRAGRRALLEREWTRKLNEESAGG